MEREELVSFNERSPLVSVRPEETDLEVLDHPDPPEDGAALNPLRLRGPFEAREEILAVRELDDDRVPLLPGLRGLTS
jgi:hypothetical protein